MRHGDSGWISLHPGEFFLLWTALGFGEPPSVLGIARAGRTSESRAALRESVDRSLSERSLGTVAEPAHDLAELLNTLAEPVVRFDLELNGQDGGFRAAGAAGPRGHVAAGIAEGELEIKIGAVTESALRSTMFAAVAPLQAGVGSPGNIPVDDYLRACRLGERGGADAFLNVLRQAGARPPEANTFLRAVSSVHGTGWFGASVEGGDGRWQRSPSIVTWVDTAEGRYALRRKAGWVTVTPADSQRLLAMADELAAELG